MTSAPLILSMLDQLRDPPQDRDPPLRTREARGAYFYVFATTSDIRFRETEIFRSFDFVGRFGSAVARITAKKCVQPDGRVIANLSPVGVYF